MEKNLKNAPSLYIYHQILTQSPKIVNLNQKNDFDSLNQSIIKKSTKDIVLSGKVQKIQFSQEKYKRYSSLKKSTKDIVLSRKVQKIQFSQEKYERYSSLKKITKDIVLSGKWMK